MDWEEFVSFKHTVSASEPRSHARRGGSPKLRIFKFNLDFPPVQNILEISFPRTNKCQSNTTYIWCGERKDRCMFWFLIKTSSGCKRFLKTGDCFLNKSKNMQFLYALYYKYVIIDGFWSILFLRSCNRASWQILVIKPTRCTNFSNLFWNETLHVSDSFSVHHRSFSLYTQQWYMSYRFADSFQTASGRDCSSILILLAKCLQTCMTYTTAVFRVKNSWWWTGELSETCRVSYQK